MNWVAIQIILIGTLRYCLANISAYFAGVVEEFINAKLRMIWGVVPACWKSVKDVDVDHICSTELYSANWNA